MTPGANSTREKVVSTPSGQRRVSQPSDLAQREDQMEKYFKGMEDPSQESPNIQKKSEMEVSQKNKFWEMLNVDFFRKGLYTYQCSFKAEQEVLDYLKEVSDRYRMIYSAAFSGLYGLHLFYYRYQMGWFAKTFGFLLAYHAGDCFGSLNSNFYSTKIISR